MNWFMQSMVTSSDPLSSNAAVSAHEGIERCPFLRNINEPTSFSFNPLARFPAPTIQAAKGPIFEDGPDFDMAFRLFHGQDGVVPLSGGRARPFPAAHAVREEEESAGAGDNKVHFNPLAAKAATISLSSFGFGGAFGFDAFSDKWNKQQKKKQNSRKDNSSKNSQQHHEAKGNEWLETGQCPIAKSYRAVNKVLPLVAKALQPPPGVVYRCPPAIVAARAALARTSLVKTLRPQPLPAKMLAIALMGMAANIPLGIWREHTAKFSPQWFVAVHAAVPFIAMLRKSVVMPKTAMAVTIAASILGQTIGSRAERMRLKKEAAAAAAAGSVEPEIGMVSQKEATTGKLKASCGGGGGGGRCESDAVAAGEQLSFLNVNVAAASGHPISSSSPKAQVCY